MLSREFVESRTLLKFVVRQIKLLVSDPTGDTVYIHAFDRVFEDIFGYSHFSRKISESSTDGEILNIINRIGMRQIVDVLKSSKLCGILRELTLLQYDVSKLRRKAKRKHQKGIRDRELIKEYNYCIKLYEKGIRAFRRRIGLKGGSKKAYKRKWNGVRSMINDNRGNEEWGSLDSLFDDEYDDYYYDDEDDYEDTSELQDFVRMIEGGKSNRKRRGRSAHRHDDDIDFDFESLYDEEDDDDYEEEESRSNLTETDKKLDKILSAMTVLSDRIGASESERIYDIVNGRDPVTHNPGSFKGSDPGLVAIQKQVTDLSSNMNALTKIMTEFNEFREDMLSILSLGSEEEEDYPQEDMVYREPLVVDSGESASEIINKYPDVLSTDMEDLPEDELKDPNTMSLHEMIDEINSSEPIQVDPVNEEENQ